MRSRISLILGVWVGLAGTLWAESKPKDSYFVKPSSQTIQRRESALTLGQSANPGQAGPALIKALDDKDDMTRALAARGLGNLKYVPALPRLSAALARDSSEDVRVAAAVSLRQMGDPRAADALSKALSDSSTNVRVTALAGLARYLDRKTLPSVEAACKDKSVDVRRTAVYVLGRFADKSAVPVVQELTKDPDAGVRAGAAQTLGELRTREAIPVLQLLLKDPDVAVQASAARALAMMGDSSGFATSSGLVHDPNLAVRILAIDALGYSADPSAGSMLQKLAGEAASDTKPAVQEALARNQQLGKKP